MSDRDQSLLLRAIPSQPLRRNVIDMLVQRLPLDKPASPDCQRRRRVFDTCPARARCPPAEDLRYRSRRVKTILNAKCAEALGIRAREATDPADASPASPAEYL
jgi:hypothetical protein